MQVWQRISRLQYNAEGAAVTEFAFVAPFLIMVTLCLYEMMSYINLNIKLNEIASVVLYCSSTKTTQSSIQDSIIGSWLIGKDYSFAQKGEVMVSGIVVVAGVRTVVWQSGSPGASSSIVTGALGVITGLPISLTSDPNQIVVEVKYRYTPSFSMFSGVFPTVTLAKTMQSIPVGTGTFNPLPA